MSGHGTEPGQLESPGMIIKHRWREILFPLRMLSFKDVGVAAGSYFSTDGILSAKHSQQRWVMVTVVMVTVNIDWVLSTCQDLI